MAASNVTLDFMGVTLEEQCWSTFIHGKTCHLVHVQLIKSMTDSMSRRIH